MSVALVHCVVVGGTGAEPVEHAAIVVDDDRIACDANPAVDIRALRGIRIVVQAGGVVRFDDLPSS